MIALVDGVVWHRPRGASDFVQGEPRPFTCLQDIAGLAIACRDRQLVRLTGPDELAFPDYDGNGMFKSLGNIIANPSVGLLFIALHGRPQRLRVNGTASVSRDDPLLAHTVGAQLIIRVKAKAIFRNCPRYLPAMQMVGPSVYSPVPGIEPPEPEWKSFPDFAAEVHPRQPVFKG